MPGEALQETGRCAPRLPILPAPRHSREGGNLPRCVTPLPAKAGTYPSSADGGGIPAYAGMTTMPLRVGDEYGKLAGKPN